MPVEENFLLSLLGIEVDFGIKIFFILLLVFYNVFAFMLYRQIQLMCHTFHNRLSPLLKFISVLHIGISLALLFAVIGLF